MIRRSLAVGILCLVGCSSRPSLTDGPSSRIDPVLEKPGGKTEDGTPIAGRAESVHFSADGKSLYLLISERPSHAAAQIYEINLVSGRERRVTWHDGDVESMDVGPGDRLLYASTTDEIKERPHPSERPSAQGQPTELYLSDRFGHQIDRLTRRPGFDGQVALSHKGDSMAFVARQGDRDVLSVGRIHAKNTRTLAATPGRSRRSPAFGVDGSLAWLEGSSPNGPFQLRISRHGKPLLSQERPLKGLRALPTLVGGWLFWERSATESVVAALTTGPLGCEKNLWGTPQDILSADLDPTGTRLAVLIENAGRTRLILKDLPPAAFTCEAPPAADKIDS